MTNNHIQEAALWASELMSRQNWCILDTETTGLDNAAEICQISLIDSAGSVLLDSLVRPTVPISPAASAIHGLSDISVASAPPITALLTEILVAVGGRDLLIYNAEFDLRLLRQSFRPYGIQFAFPTSDRRKCRIFLNGGSIHCVMRWYSQWCDEWNQYHNDFKWQRLPGGDHSALGDCRATLEVVRNMAESFVPVAVDDGIPF